jgi:hypothetical protein
MNKVRREITRPELVEGWNLLEADSFRAFPSILLQHIHEYEEVLWIDSSNQASTHYFESRPEALEKLSIARAFTPLQHHQICQKLEGYDLIVAPKIDKLYHEGSLYESEAEQLFKDAIENLETPVIFSTIGTGLKVYADNIIRVEETEQGLKYSDGKTQTHSYQGNGFKQLTVEAYQEVEKWEEPIKPTETA